FHFFPSQSATSKFYHNFDTVYEPEPGNFTFFIPFPTDKPAGPEKTVLLRLFSGRRVLPSLRFFRHSSLLHMASRCWYFSRVARPPRIWRSDLLMSRTTLALAAREG